MPSFFLKIIFQVRQAAAYGIGILAKSGPSEANDSLKEFVSALGQLIEGPLGRGDSNPEQIESTENAIRYFKYRGLHIRQNCN